MRSASRRKPRATSVLWGGVSPSQATTPLAQGGFPSAHYLKDYYYYMDGCFNGGWFQWSHHGAASLDEPRTVGGGGPIEGRAWRRE